MKEILAKDKSLDIYEYLDCRLFLKDWFELKKEGSNFSIRSFAQRMGFTGGDVIVRILSGKRKLGSNHVFKFIKGMQLTAKEAQYFEAMVSFGNADSSEESAHYFERLQSMIPSHEIRRLRKNEYEYLSRWFHMAIRSLLGVYSTANIVKIASLLEFNVSLESVQKSIDLQIELGLLGKDENQKYVLLDGNLESGDLLKEPALIQLNKELFDLAKVAMEYQNQAERKIYGVNFSLSEEGYQRIVKKAQLFLQEARAIADNDSNENRVYQMNLQLFPLSKSFN
jgi:uncharacterized protein (TIGR02147 family)